MNARTKRPADTVEASGAAYVEANAEEAGDNAKSSGILFDPYRRAATKELSAAITKLAGDLSLKEGALGLRTRARGYPENMLFHRAVECIVCNLLIIAMIGTERPLAAPRSNEAMRGANRHRPEVYGRHFVDALDLMAHPQVGLIEKVAKGYKFAGKEGRLSTIRATPKLIAMMPSVTDWSAFRREQAGEVLVLRSSKRGGDGEDIAFDETPKIAAMRKRMVALNKWLASAPIFLAPGCPLFGDTGQPIDPSRRSLRRIFNNGKWNEGGRLYDGFWETMRKEDRKRFLLIGTPASPLGEPSSSADFNQLFPRLAYTMAPAQAPEGDLYAILKDRGTKREGIKLLMNAMLFAQGPIKRWPRDARQHFPGVSLQEAVAAIEAAHRPIARFFGTGIGYRLFYEESVILLDVLDVLRKRGIVALPLHDAVLIAASQAEEAQEVMAARLLQVLPEETRAMVSIG